MCKINVKNKSKWKGDGFYVGRPSPLSNPYKITKNTSRNDCIEKYKSYLTSAIQSDNPDIINALTSLLLHLFENQKINLICYCSPKPCHADVIKQVLLNAYHTNDYLIKGKI